MVRAFAPDHQLLAVDTALITAVIERILDLRQPSLAQEEAQLLAALLRGHLVMLIPAVQRLMPATAQQEADSSSQFTTHHVLEQAHLLPTAASIYIARRTLAVVLLALCRRDLHRHYGAALLAPSPDAP